jgi:predicted AAA+ superfamily ATPase
MTISQVVLKRIILDQHEDQSWPSQYIQRTADQKLKTLSQNQEVIVVTGLRRCGKSVLLENFRRSCGSENDYYFNFEDERLVNFSIEDFEVLHQTFISLYGIQKTFYLDEIQNILGWELFIRRLYNRGCKIYITGSNANLFSEELGTRLTGRYIELKIYPISFSEFSQYQIPLEQKDFSTTGIGNLKKVFFEYLECGGIPAYIENKNTDYLISLYESILYRDIVVRYKIANPQALRKLLFFLASNYGKEISYSKLLGMINNNGKIVKSLTTISDYCGHIENSFLCFFVNRYDDSLKTQQKSPKKVYFIDHVLAKIVGFRTSEDRGQTLENLVFLELKRRGYDIYYHKENKECDFIVRKGVKTMQAIQVCTEIYDPSTKRREILGLTEAMDRFNLLDGLIITENEEYTETIKIENKKYNISVEPIWKWLRNNVKF